MRRRVSAAEVDARRGFARGLSRAALVLASTAAVAGCGKETKSPDPSPSPTPVDTGLTVAPAYGAPVPPPMPDADTRNAVPSAGPDAGAKKK
jgi:hypothetical protein